MFLIFIISLRDQGAVNSNCEYKESYQSWSRNVPWGDGWLELGFVCWVYGFCSFALFGCWQLFYYKQLPLYEADLPVCICWLPDLNCWPRCCQSLGSTRLERAGVNRRAEAWNFCLPHKPLNFRTYDCAKPLTASHRTTRFFTHSTVTHQVSITCQVPLPRVLGM